MHHRPTRRAPLLIALGGSVLFGPLARAQGDAPTAGELPRVEITGSAIRRIDAETAVPVTILRVDELKRQGITSVEQIVQTISAMQAQISTSGVVGAGTGGASFADLRGIGQNKTLVLLNGRRIANNAIDGSAPDLNMIPFGALARVEVLRDGASALYGTDAIGGVINFITRRDFTGGTATIGRDAPQHGGGKTTSANAGFGFGDLAQDNFNVFGFLDHQKQAAITGSDRSFGVNGKVSTVAFPANYFQGAGATRNPAAPGCAGTYLKPNGDGTSCVYNTNLWIDYAPFAERTSGMLKGTLQLTPNHRLDLEYFATRSRVTAAIAPVPYSLTVNPGTAFYPGNGIVPAPPAGVVIDPTLPISVKFRDEPDGGRVGATDNTQQRFIAALDGTLGAWDYRTGVSYNQNKVTDKVVAGYTNGDVVAAGVADGTINPFGEQTAAGAALLASAAVKGKLQGAKGTVASIDARAGRELGDWFVPGKPAAFAVGAEFRHEKFSDIANPDVAALVQASTGLDASTHSVGSRTVSAMYLELNLPVLKTLELSGAVRYDKYSDFGNTTNPKFGFRFQPVAQVLVRGSYSTGFRAPSLYDLNAAQTFTFTANPWNDPVRCPGGAPIPGAAPATNCNTQFLSLLGGNHALRPETARNRTLGLVLEPASDLTFGLDFWWIGLKHQIHSLDDNTVFGNPTKFAGLFHRAGDGSLSTSGTDCPGANCGYVELTTQNLGGVNTNGVDLAASWRASLGEAGKLVAALNSTYVNRYEYQTEEGGEFNQNVGVYSGAAAIFRWQHTATANWTRGAWGAGLVGHYKSGYTDQKPGHRVGSYTVIDGHATWRPTAAITLTAGVRNLFDRDPPFSNQGTTFQQGYDPRYADAVGRSYYLRGSYDF